MLAVAAWLGSSLGALAGPAVPTFSQRSAQWSRQALGGDRVDTIGSARCGPTGAAWVPSANGHFANPGTLHLGCTGNRGDLEDDTRALRPPAPLSQRH